MRASLLTAPKKCPVWGAFASPSGCWAFFAGKERPWPVPAARLERPEGPLAKLAQGPKLVGRKALAPSRVRQTKVWSAKPTKVAKLGPAAALGGCAALKRSAGRSQSSPSALGDRIGTTEWSVANQKTCGFAVDRSPSMSCQPYTAAELARVCCSATRCRGRPGQPYWERPSLQPS